MLNTPNKSMLPKSMSFFFDKENLISEVINTSKAIAFACTAQEPSYKDIFDGWLPHFYDPKKKNIKKRLKNWKFIKRRLLDLIIAESLYYEQKTGKVGGNSGKAYVGETTLKIRQQRLAHNQSLLDNMGIITSNGFVALSELSTSAHSKFCELYLMCLGMEHMASDKGFRAVFITATAPPYLHPNPTKGKKKWNGKNAKVAHEYIKKRWGAFKRDLSRPQYNIKFSEGDAFGFRVVEPHKDGTPHWHLLMYASLENIEGVITELANKHFGFNQSKNAVKIELIKTKEEDDNAAAPTTYMTKYLMKNVDYREGVDGVQSNGEKIEDTEALEKIDAWKSALGVRTYQTFGILSAKTKWRTLRKLYNQLQSEFGNTFLQTKLLEKVQSSHKRLDKAKSNKWKDIYKKNMKWAFNRYCEIERNRTTKMVVEIDNNSSISLHEMMKLISTAQTRNKPNDKGQFSKFLRLLEKIESQDHSIYVKESYENAYGETSKRIVGVDLGCLKYKFVRYELQKKEQEVEKSSMNLMDIVTKNAPT